MACSLLLFISLLTYKTGFSAEISVFVQTRDSVQLDIQTQKLPEIEIFSWTNEKSEVIVRYNNGTKTVKCYPSYKDRVYFNDETFSLTLKNMQKTDSGLYTARTSGEFEKNILIYRVSVIDAVEAPVLTVNSSWSSSDPCSFTCEGTNVIISSLYNSSSCSPEEVTSSDNYTLRLNCSGDYIMCNHSNPVSWKTDRKKVNELCSADQEIPHAVFFQSALPLWFILLICLLTVSLLASVIGWCVYKRKKGHSYSPEQQNDELTVYEKVGSTTLTEKSQPSAAVTISTIEKQPKSDTVYAVVTKQPAKDESVRPRLE